ncbi:MAG: LysR family transcriptional regulator [Acidimicrobiales bacterium]
MTLGQLRTFLAVAAAGSVRTAAERLVVTQPAVSAALASLQREVGAALVVREGRGLRLTASGVAFSHYARRALGLLEEGLAAAAGAAEPERGRVRLAAVTTAGERIVPRLLASFRAEYPGAEVALEVGNRAHVWDLLAHHEVDLAIGGRPPGAQPFVSLATRPNTLVVVGPASPSGAEDLATSTWLLREPGSGTRETAEELLRELEVSPPVLTIGSNGAILESVRIGLGITLISRDAVGPELETGRLVEWRHTGLPLRREWHLVGRSDERLTPTAGLMLAHLVGAEDGFHLVS